MYLCGNIRTDILPKDIVKPPSPNPIFMPEHARAMRGAGATLNDKAWEVLFDKLDVLKHVSENGYFDITSEQINTLSGRQSRLMTKIDFRENLPTQFKKHGLSILAYHNGVYRIAQNDPFIEIAPLGKVIPQKVFNTEDIVSFNADALTSEKKVLRMAARCGIIEAVCGEPVHDMNPDLHFSEKFDFEFQGCHYPVDGVQLEIDGVYEGAKRITAIEAKMGFRSNISLRQIAYPHLNLTKIANNRREIRTFVLLYEAPLLRFIPIVCAENVWRADHAEERVFELCTTSRDDYIDGVKPLLRNTEPEVSTVVKNFLFAKHKIASLFSAIKRQVIDTETI